MINISINVPLEGKALYSVLLAQDILHKKMNISFQKNNQSIPHVNLLSGKIREIELQRLKIDIEKLNKKIIKNNFKMKANGLGVFILDRPVIYMRHYYLRFFLVIRRCLTLEKYFNVIDNSTLTKFWMPKTTIAHKDTNSEDLTNILLLLKQINFYEDSKINKINLSSFASDKPEIII